MPIIEGDMLPDESGVKRFYMPGLSIKDNCPNCNTEYKSDLKEHYISYPNFNKKTNYSLYCNNCNHEWKIPIMVKVTLEIEDHY